jgi:hypothetical protein
MLAAALFFGSTVFGLDPTSVPRAPCIPQVSSTHGGGEELDRYAGDNFCLPFSPVFVVGGCAVTSTIAGSDRQGFANGHGTSAQFNGLGLICVEYVCVLTSPGFERPSDLLFVCGSSENNIYAPEW